MLRRYMPLAMQCALLGILSLGCATGQVHKEAHASGPWAFTYFKSNGETGLHLACSEDGLDWKELNGGQPVFNAQVGSTKLMRDPCAIVGADGRFHMVWTTGWDGNDIGYANSADLIHWSEPKVLHVMEHEPAVRNSWAPELLYNDKTGEYLIFWASTIPGRFPDGDGQDANAANNNPGYNHRLYYTKTKDFESFAPTRVYFEPGFNAIDATVEKVGELFVMVFKDERNRPLTPQKNLKIAFADDPEGPWSASSEPFSGEQWAEGPTALKAGDRWLVLWDKYRDRRYGAAETRDFKAFTDISDQLKFPAGMRHGSAVPVTAAQLHALRRLRPAAN